MAKEPISIEFTEDELCEIRRSITSSAVDLEMSLNNSLSEEFGLKERYEHRIKLCKLIIDKIDNQINSGK